MQRPKSGLLHDSRGTDTFHLDTELPAGVRPRGVLLLNLPGVGVMWRRPPGQSPVRISFLLQENKVFCINKLIMPESISVLHTILIIDSIGKLNFKYKNFSLYT